VNQFSITPGGDNSPSVSVSQYSSKSFIQRNPYKNPSKSEVPMSNADIFETMEREMKQIMDLFAKERKSRKKEMQKLQKNLEDEKSSKKEMM
jgi:hypothetical protein